MNVRTATPADMPAVLQLIQELATFEKEPDAVVLTSEDLIRDGFGDRPLFRVLIAEHQDEIIGMALFYYRYSTWKGKTIHLEDLIVTEQARGTGAGMALYKKVIQIAKDEQVRRVEWVVLNWNQPAIDFYQKSGAHVLEDWYTVQMDEQGIQAFINN
ncbi:GNAT family N-acetyltransferase [Myroides sp. 1354]|uniref:GNAT family N-acetyltransferase n=1 Tax=unclassified Myroides TaxID=2642485 RepID=UPI0025768590|nr:MULTISPECIES: GNAT family N-acetyltransferase [unclassified Myroides]MDM1043514.1 GNAT family N-acetyltransferase [Myroides sp. R163-1]MDM1054436.1 GNAT family N-acetyltransferase [Myroides sp. 1354]MDM1067732.1 GNAT family N-acetyltransferase [Myroides sp. 1372]